MDCLIEYDDCITVTLASVRSFPKIDCYGAVRKMEVVNIILQTVVVLLQAVCCSDQLHCCPNGYTCDLSSGTCNKDQHSMSWNAMTMRNVGRSSSNDICPGGKQSCPDSNTCCQLLSGDYGCCPYPQVLIMSLPMMVCLPDLVVSGCMVFCVVIRDVSKIWILGVLRLGEV